jgi:hypothetical protein
MKGKGNHIVMWIPRVLAIAFTVFLGLFALDVFGQGYTFWETVAGLLIHLIPNFILIAVIIFAWKHPWVGMAAFALLAVVYVVMTRGRESISAYLLISLPLLLIGALYGWDWLNRRKSEN